MTKQAIDDKLETTGDDVPPPRSTAGALVARLRRVRARVRRHPRANLVWRIAIAVLGTLVLALGVLAIPYPGPGWLIVFAGLGILATEFTWAGRLLRFARHYYDAWSAWLGRQSLLVKLLVATATAAVVLLTLWLLGALGMVAGWVGLDGWTWLRSPLKG